MSERPEIREAVFKVIDSERDYQIFRASQVGKREQLHSVCDYLVYMEDYLREMKTQLARIWTNDGLAPPEALDTLRKITALGVVCMEQNGAQKRKF
jgi:hypothetical protein